MMAEGNFDVLILNTKAHERYLDDASRQYVSSYNPDYDSSRALYLVFSGKENADDPELGKWMKTSEAGCGWQIWQRADN